jgi:hypothetical protein
MSMAVSTDCSNFLCAGPAQKLKRPEPGDPGLDPRVLDYDTFNKLPAMQHGNPQRRLSRDVNAPTEPKCDWQEYQAPYPQVREAYAKCYNYYRGKK